MSIYQSGVDAINSVSPLRWPKTFSAVADLLEVQDDLFREVRRSGLRGKELTHLQALHAWHWLCFKSRNPFVRERLGLELHKRRKSSPLTFEEGLTRISLVPFWPCSHRKLGIFLDVSYTLPGIIAKEKGIDTSRGFTREAAETVWREICRRRSQDQDK